MSAFAAGKSEALVAGFSVPMQQPWPRPYGYVQCTSTSASPRKEQATLIFQAIMSVFVRHLATDWNAFQNIAGLDWDDKAPMQNPDISDPHLTYSRSGSCLMIGLDTVDVPDSSPSYDGVRLGNEGECVVTLSGNVDEVHEISIVKWYPANDALQLLRKQFAANIAIAVVDDYSMLAPTNHGSDAGNSQFYRITYPGAAVLHVEVIVDDQGGRNRPGSTQFIFSRNRSDQRALDRRCRED